MTPYQNWWFNKIGWMPLRFSWNDWWAPPICWHIEYRIPSAWTEVCCIGSRSRMYHCVELHILTWVCMIVYASQQWHMNSLLAFSEFFWSCITWFPVYLDIFGRFYAIAIGIRNIREGAFCDALFVGLFSVELLVGRVNMIHFHRSHAMVFNAFLQFCILKYLWSSFNYYSINSSRSRLHNNFGVESS